MKNQLTIIFLLLTLIVFGQQQGYERVDYDQIKKEINNKKSPYFYPEIKKKVLEQNTSLTEKELFYFYYGAPLQKDFSSIERVTVPDKIKEIQKKNNQTEADWLTLLSFYEKTYQTRPLVDLETLSNLSFIYSQTKQLEKSKAIIEINFRLIDAIFSTGDGISEESAIEVISVAHEYSILRLIGFHSLQQALVHNDKRSYDKHSILLDERDRSENPKTKPFYFDVTKIMESYSEMFQ